VHPDAEARLDQLRETLDGKVGGEVLAAALVGAAGARVRRQVAAGTGRAPRMGRSLILATTPTRLVLLEAATAPPTDGVVARRLVGDWPLDLARVDAAAVQAHAKDGLGADRWGVTLSVPSDELEIVLDAPRGPAVDELLASIVATTGGALRS
jgi:hypothetical protein